jgi:ATP-binding cassette, subfamily B, multidrug efflux pump
MVRTSRFQTLLSYLRPYSRNTGLGILALFVTNALSVFIALQIRSGIGILETKDNSQIVQLAILVLCLATVMMATRLISRVLLFGVGRQVEFDLKQKLFNHLLVMDPAYFSSNTIGDLISRSTSDVESIRRLVGFAVLSFANTIFVYALTLPTMVLINPKLSLVSVGVYPLMLVVVNLFANRMRNEQTAVQEQLSRISEMIQEDMSGIALIKIYAQEENERSAFRELNDQLLQANLGLAKTRTLLFRVLEGVAAFSVLLLLWVGSGDLENGTLQVKDFIALIILTGQLAFPTALMGFTITAYQRGEVSIDRVESILATQSKILDKHDALGPKPQSQLHRR